MLFLPTYFPDLFKIKSTKEKQLCNLSSSFFVFFKNNALNLNHVIFSLFLFFLHREIYIGKLKANKAASPPLQNINGGEKLDYHLFPSFFFPLLPFQIEEDCCSIYT